MYGDVALQIELHRGSQVSVLDVQDDRALIGSGAHCDLRLAPDEAAVEQLLIEAVGDDEVYARARTLEPPCLLNGAPFLEGRLSPASVLELGSVALCVRRAARQDPASSAPASPRKSATSPPIQALGLGLVAFGLWHVLSPKPADVSALARAVAPPPFAAKAQPLCPVASEAAAVALAAQTLLEAESLRERAAFYPGEATPGAELFARAGACFALAGVTLSAAEARAAARALEVQAADAIHLGHVRLERFLATDQFSAAHHQAALLLELVADTAGDYRAWLEGVIRECDLRANAVKR